MAFGHAVDVMLVVTIALLLMIASLVLTLLLVELPLGLVLTLYQLAAIPSSIANIIASG